VTLSYFNPKKYSQLIQAYISKLNGQRDENGGVHFDNVRAELHLPILEVLLGLGILVYSTHQVAQFFQPNIWIQFGDGV
jgi:hypothetical protein